MLTFSQKILREICRCQAPKKGKLAGVPFEPQMVIHVLCLIICRSSIFPPLTWVLRASLIAGRDGTFVGCQICAERRSAGYVPVTLMTSLMTQWNIWVCIFWHVLPGSFNPYCLPEIVSAFYVTQRRNTSGNMEVEPPSSRGKLSSRGPCHYFKVSEWQCSESECISCAST